jgi:peptidoglycan/LPS O-acetylase OafA/YrhL
MLALCVVCYHAPNNKIFGRYMLSGATAVEGFFIVSGFLITMILQTRPAYRSLAKFYLSRYLRLWPAYIVVAILSLTIVKHDWVESLAKFDWPSMAFVIATNAVIFFQDLYPFFAITADGTSIFPTSHFLTEPGRQFWTLLLIPPSWTLGIELFFYAMAPYFCRSGKRLLVLFAMSVMVRIYLGTITPPLGDPWVYRFWPAEMAFFAAGGLAYLGGDWLVQRVSPATLRFLGWTCIASTIAVVFKWVPSPGAVSLPFFILNPLALACIFISCPILFFTFRDNRTDSMIGELSYPIYLSHYFMLESITLYAPQLWVNGNVFYVMATLALSVALLKFVILPTDRIRSRFGARRPEVVER